MSAIQVEELTKRYGDIKAVDRISFSVEYGETFGMVGPNGSGKTTTIECLEGLRQPDSGSLDVLGMRPDTDRKKLNQLIGVQLQETQYQDKIKVHELCSLFSSFGLSPTR